MYFNGTKCCSLVLCCLLSLSLYAKDAKSTSGSPGLHKPVCFVENKGQVVDQDNHPRNDIQYRLSTPGLNLYVGNNGLHYQFKEVKGTPGAESSVSAYRVDVTLLGANPEATVSATEQQPYYENYYLGQYGGDGFTAHAWNKIIYKDVYPDIDWVLYVKDNKIEYDFNVRPGGNIADIKLQYGGATSLRLTSDGSLAAETPMGRVTEKSPYAYEQSTGIAVTSRFKLDGNVLSFETGKYTGALVIDPYLLWSTYLGGTLEDVVTSVAVSPAQETYVGGYTSSNGLATALAFKNTFQGGAYDAFLAKYNNAGVLQWCTYMGGTGTDKGTSVALESSGANVYLAGVTGSPATGLTTGGAYHGANNGLNDGFLIKFNGAGIRQWCTFYGGANNDNINAVAVDGLNNVYVAGQTASVATISSPGAYQTIISGVNDAFIAKFNAAGTNLWSTYYGGTAQDQIFGLACDAAGNVFVAGQTSSVTNMATATSFQPAISGSNDAFIAMFNTLGTRVWGTYYGGAGTDLANGIAYDPVNNKIAIIGNTNSPASIASANGFQTAFGGLQDAFITYFDVTGNRLWGTYYGGLSVDYGQAICFDIYGNLIVAGGTFSVNGIANTNSFQPAIGGDYDAFVAKINPQGQTIWNTYFGGTFYDFANGVACDLTNQISVGGYTTSLGNYGSGGLSTAGAQQIANAGGPYDGFITKFKTDTFVLINQPFTDTLVCQGGPFNVSYTVYSAGATFQPGNTFTVQLSNAAGSFAVPVTIGSVAATGSGTIACTIPALTPLGAGYRIRIIASNPAFTSPDDHLNIVVQSATLPGTTAGSNSPVCVGGDLHLYDNAPYSISTYSWTGPAGFLSASANPTLTLITLANAGTYSVTTVHNGCPSSSATVTVVVNSFIPPTPVATSSAGCAGGTLSLFANPDTTAFVTYHWSGPLAFSSTAQNPSITSTTVSNAGYYFVQDTLQGCPSAQAFTLVTINPVLPVSVSISANTPYYVGAPGDTICAGTMVNFTAHPVNGGPAPTYQWMTGPASPVIGAVSSTWSSPTLTDGQQVFVVIHSSVDCPSALYTPSNKIAMNVISNSPLVYISAVPGIHVAPGSSITFLSSVYNAGIGPVYQWKKNGVAIPGANGNSFTLTGVTHMDTISLEVTSTMLCASPDSSSSNLLFIGTNVGVANISAGFSNIGLFPNPNSGTFTIKGQLESTDQVTFEITNLLGQVMFRDETSVTDNELNKTIDLQHIPNGIYLLRLYQNGASKIFRFSVQY